MKKTFRKAMLSTMAMLLVGVMSLTGVTYAWFTSGTAATVDKFTVNVAGGSTGSLMISTDNNGTLSFARSAGFTPADGKLVPVSTIGPAADGTAPILFKAEVVDETKIKSTSFTTPGTSGATEKTEHGYYTFDVYFRNDGTQSITVILDPTTTSFMTNTADMSKKGAIATYEAKSAALAARIAFVKSKSVKFQGNSVNSYTGNYALTPASENAVQIYEPNAAKHLDFGIIDQGIINPKGEGETAWGAERYGYKALTAASGENAFHRYNFDDTQDATNYLTEDEVAITEIGADLITVDAGSVAKVTVYIWLEGQDVDCINEISGKDIQCNLGFKIKDAAAS